MGVTQRKRAASPGPPNSGKIIEGQATGEQPTPGRETPAESFADVVARQAVVSLIAIVPVTCAVLAFVTCSEAIASPTLGSLAAYGGERGVAGTVVDALHFIGIGTRDAWIFLGCFNLFALVLYWLPGPTKFGPLTPMGHKPAYTDNGIAHCVIFPAAFLAGALLLRWYDLGIMYDLFPGIIGAVNFFGLVFCLFLYFKGLYLPSTADAGSSGCGFLFDYYWGTELYPRIGWVDVKKFVNCRFSMTFWMLAGVSYSYRSYTLHGQVDPGLVLSAVSQFLYLCKFYAWEIGYMRSIDIIVDRAGFYETWGCLVFVPSLYTLHTRLLVRSPSGLSWWAASAIFGLGMAGVALNYWADAQRQRFREKEGNCLVWGRKPQLIRAEYEALNAETGKMEKHTSLLLASGWWGTARHLQYLFELTAAWSWGLLGGVLTHGALPLFYPIFLTTLLIHRAHRDEQKCLDKYGEYYKQYMKMVPYKIIPFVY